MKIKAIVRDRAGSFLCEWFRIARAYSFRKSMLVSVMGQALFLFSLLPSFFSPLFRSHFGSMEGEALFQAFHGLVVPGLADGEGGVVEPQIAGQKAGLPAGVARRSCKNQEGRRGAGR